MTDRRVKIEDNLGQLSRYGVETKRLLNTAVAASGQDVLGLAIRTSMSGLISLLLCGPEGLKAAHILKAHGDPGLGDVEAAHDEEAAVVREIELRHRETGAFCRSHKECRASEIHLVAAMRPLQALIL